MSKYSGNDHYIDPKTVVLKNKLGLTSQEELEQEEVNYVATRSLELAKCPIEEPLLVEALKAIHKKLFSDVYEWAGTFRDVDITKGNSRFANFKFIESYLNTLFTQLQNEKELQGLPPKSFSERAAYYMAELNAIHPFREGNGRTQRELLSQLSYRNGYIINWGNMTEEGILKATIQSFHGNLDPLSNLIFNNLEQISPVR